MEAKAAKIISKASLEAYRSQTFRLGRGRQLRDEDEAVRFVDERGFAYFWPIKGVDLPSLWVAVPADGWWPRSMTIRGM